MRLALAIVLLAPALARGQGADAALKDRVAQLVTRLDAPKADARDAAQAALIKLGPRILPLLPEPTGKLSAEQKARLTKVRDALNDLGTANLGPSKVTIQAQGIRLTEVVKQIQAQTGNRISDLREQFGAEVTNPALDLDLKEKTFFEALDLVAKKAGIAFNYFTGDGTIGI